MIIYSVVLMGLFDGIAPLFTQDWRPGLLSVVPMGL
jgi:hypothetical protein